MLGYRTMSHLAGIATALPPTVVSQEEAQAVFEKIYGGQERLLRLLRIFPTCGVRKRHFAFPPDYYRSERDFELRNRDFIEQGTELGARAARGCLEKAGVLPREVDHLHLVTTTGLATPSLDALLVSRLGLRPDVRRWPLFGLGCAGGVGGLIRAGDAIQGFPRQVSLLVSVELCGQVFSPRAQSPVDVVGAALFGDGAAAALVAGPESGAPRGPRLRASRTLLFDDTQDLMGWKFTSGGLRLVLSEAVAGLVRERLRPSVEEFLSKEGLSLRDIRHWVLHPGGSRILEAYRDALGLSEAELHWARTALAEYGNLSSASALFAFSELVAARAPQKGDLGLMVGLGPGFAAEMLVLEW
jgi:alkylresorcinol/alkylpyrone synthase